MQQNGSLVDGWQHPAVERVVDSVPAEPVDQVLQGRTARGDSGHLLRREHIIP